jgi:hypothetical protein
MGQVKLTAAERAWKFVLDDRQRSTAAELETKAIAAGISRTSIRRELALFGT